MAKKKPTHEKSFTPSYSVGSKGEYKAQLDRCRKFLRDGDMDSWVLWGCKPHPTARTASGEPAFTKYGRSRLDARSMKVTHTMIEGGRKSSRYPDARWAGGKDPGDYPPDPRTSPSGFTRGGGPSAKVRGRPKRGTLPETDPGTRKGKPEGAKTHRRLDTPNPLFYARTQPVDRRKPGPGLAVGGPELDIARAIEQYRRAQPGGEIGFSVPFSAGPLTVAGMPEKAAKILVSRAAGAFYPEVPYTELVSSVSLLYRVEGALGGKLIMESKTIVKGGPIDQAQIEGRADLGYVQEISVSAGDNWEMLLDGDGIASKYAAWEREIIAERTKPDQPGFYRKENDDPAFFNDLFEGLQPRISHLAEAWLDPRLILEVFLSGAKDEFRIPVPAGEHSKLFEYEAMPSHPKYKTLENVSLTDLPALLARISRRKKRKGRQLQPLSSARSNPSMIQPSDNSILKHVFEKAYQESPQLVSVPGKPGRVYWPQTKLKVVSRRVVSQGDPIYLDGSWVIPDAEMMGRKFRVPLGLREVDSAQAESWLTIAETGRKVGPDLSRVADQFFSGEGMSSRPSLPSPPSSAATPARENPMSNSDNWYWEQQYNMGWDPEGAESQPRISRRNRKSKSKTGKAYKPRTISPAASAKFEAVARRAQQIMSAVPGCDLSAAMKQAWAEVKGMKAAANPWYPGTPSLYLPDNPVPGALVQAPYEWSDETEVFTALVPGPYANNNPHNPMGHANAGRHVRGQLGGPSVATRKHGAFYEGPYSTPGDYLLGVGREDLVAMGTPAAKAELRRRGRDDQGVKLAWAEKKPQKAAANPFDDDDYSVPFRGATGQFSTQQRRYQGIQPVNRRNPNAMTARFPGECCMCGGEIVRGDQIADSGMRGPQGGKKMAHLGCL